MSKQMMSYEQEQLDRWQRIAQQRAKTIERLGKEIIQLESRIALLEQDLRQVNDICNWDQYSLAKLERISEISRKHIR